jgi:glycosyltransferase involved in cell wall biosynthesis
VLVVCHDVVGPSMAGPGIRYREIAAALHRRERPVTLAAAPGSDLAAEPYPAFTYRLDGPELVDAARRADALLVTGPILEQFPALKGLGRPIVVDMYDPFLFENLHRLRGLDERWPHHEGGLRVLAEQARCGDWFVCANERQRDLYLGMLATWGRVNPTTYDADPTLRSLIDVLPFGLPSEPPRAGAVPEAQAGERLVVWNGGLWDWFDPCTAIRAVARLADVRLLFLGTRHPNPAVGEPPTAGRARALAAELGLRDRRVFFREWTPYAERGAALLAADAAISLHLPGVETRYASRTRLLDWIWSGRPGVVTAGDVIGDDLAARGLAVSVAPLDEVAAAEALARVLDAPPARAGFAGLAAELTWDRCVEPLACFARAPRRAADRG